MYGDICRRISQVPWVKFYPSEKKMESTSALTNWLVKTFSGAWGHKSAVDGSLFMSCSTQKTNQVDYKPGAKVSLSFQEMEALTSALP